MKIISHRGYWFNPEEKNKLISFERSFNLRFGVETDIRDSNRILKIAHDMPTEIDLNATEFFKMASKYQDLPLALNVKADGLHFEIDRLIKAHKIKNYFLFDMSLPDTFNYERLGLKYLVRESEFEKINHLYDQAYGVWLDCFKEIWYSKDCILNHNKNNKMVALVSEELHNRNQLSQWRKLKEWGVHKLDQVIICTDYPEKAFQFFNT